MKKVLKLASCVAVIAVLVCAVGIYVSAESSMKGICSECDRLGCTVQEGLVITDSYVKLDETQHARYYKCENGHLVIGYKNLETGEYDKGYYDAGEHVAETEATCQKKAVCILCGEEFGDYGEHSYGEGVVTAPTCTEKGYITYSCTVCGETKTEDGEAATSHSYGEGVVTAPTCTEKGYVTYTCTVCGATKTEDGEAATGHSYGEGNVIKPTCTEKGATEYTCAVCGNKKYEDVTDELGHTYDTGKVTAPTCWKKGYTTYTCTVCGATKRSDETDALMHWYDEWVPVSEGKMSAPCKRSCCNYTKTTDCIDWKFTMIETVEEEDAAETEETAEEKTEPVTYYVCPVCGQTSDATRLKIVSKATSRAITGWISYGDLVVRVGELANGEKIMSVGYEYDARLVNATGETSYTVPAEVLDGYKLMLLDEEGNETEVEVTVKDDQATFVLDFTAPWQERVPVRILHLVPVEA